MDNKLILLAKLGKEEHMRSLQEGKMYFKRLGYYAELEEKNGDKSMGDKKEGKHYMTQCQYSFYDYETHELVGTFDNVKTYFESNNTTDMPVFCMVALQTKDLEVIENNKYLLEPKKVLKDMLTEDYWSSALIITNIKEFFYRIEKKCKEDGISVNGNLVNYTDMEINYSNREESIEADFNNVAFWKDNKYKGQFEYRIVLTDKRVDDSYTLDIGDISDISILLDNQQFEKVVNGKYSVEDRIKQES